MFKKHNNGPQYYQEEVSNTKIIIFCSVIAFITIAIIVFTGYLAYVLIQNNHNVEADVEDYSTIGKKNEVTENKARTRRTVTPPNIANNVENNVENVTAEPEAEPKISEEPSSTQKAVKATSNFPRHDYNAAIASQLPSYSDEIAKKVVDVYYEKAKKIYLTFDDGPSQNTQAILDILDKYNVKATFFVLGSNVDSKPELVKKEYEKGHFIANHSYTHSYRDIYASTDSILNEYNRCTTAIQNAIGVPSYNPHLFRFPGGSYGGPYHDVKQAGLEVLKQNQIASTNWNCLTGDAAGSTTKEAMWAELKESAVGDDNLVILMHDAADKQVTVEFLPELIEYYQALGYEFCTYYDVMCE